MINYFWQKWGKRYWSYVICFLTERQYRNTKLPMVFNTYDVQLELKKLSWKADRFFDYFSTPQKVVATGEADCEDLARFAGDRLMTANIPAVILSVLTRPKERSHSVCVFKQGGLYSYFDNKKLIETDAQSYAEIAVEVARGAHVTAWAIHHPRTLRMIRYWRAK